METNQTDRASRIESVMKRVALSMSSRGTSKRIVYGGPTDRDRELVVLQKRLRRALVKAEAEGLGSFTVTPE